MRILLGALTLAVGVIAFLNLNGGAQTLQDIPLASGTERAPVARSCLHLRAVRHVHRRRSCLQSSSTAMT